MYTDTNDDFPPFGPWQHGFQRGMGGFRAGRGMIEPAILSLLATKPMHGYEIISTFEEMSHGMWRPSAGSIYPTLQLLEEKGHINSVDIDGKKVYELTESGKEESEKSEPFKHPSWQAKADRLHDMHHDMKSIMMNMRKIARRGTDEQRASLTSIVKEFREKLELIIKEKQ